MSETAEKPKFRFMASYEGAKGERHVAGAFPFRMPTESTFSAIRRAVESLASLEIKADKMNLEQW